MSYTIDDWLKLTAEEKIQAYNQAVNLFRNETVTLEPGTRHFFLISCLIEGDSGSCDYCDELCSDMLLIPLDDEVEGEVLEKMGIDYNCCAYCVEQYKEDQKPENRRMKLIQRIERYTGMPTLDYDNLIEEAQNELIEIEKSMLNTCEGCGGEAIPSSIADVHIPEWGMLSFVPENGLCSMELPDCGVVS